MWVLVLVNMGPLNPKTSVPTKSNVCLWNGQKSNFELNLNETGGGNFFVDNIFTEFQHGKELKDIRDIHLKEQTLLKNLTDQLVTYWNKQFWKKLRQIEELPKTLKYQNRHTFFNKKYTNTNIKKSKENEVYKTWKTNAKNNKKI